MRLVTSLRTFAIVGLVVASLAAMSPANAVTSAPGTSSVDHAGFTVTSDSVRVLQARWSQPEPTCQQTPSFATFQFGFISATRQIAVGTEADCHDGTVSQYAWVDFGRGRKKLPETVTPSDVMFAKVLAGKRGLAVIVGDQTAGWGEGFSTAGRHRLDVTGAFCGVVARTGASGVQPLTDFGTLKFLSCTVNHQPIKNLHPTLVTMKDGSGVVMAKPSVVKGRPAGVVWKHA